MVLVVVVMAMASAAVDAPWHVGVHGAARCTAPVLLHDSLCRPTSEALSDTVLSAALLCLSPRLPRRVLSAGRGLRDHPKRQVGVRYKATHCDCEGGGGTVAAQ